MSRFLQDIRLARMEANLPKRFRARDVMNACHEWSPSTCSTFMSKHCVGNLGGYRAYFRRHSEASLQSSG